MLLLLSLALVSLRWKNGFRDNSFPVIVADATICRESRLLESEFDEEAKVLMSF